MKYHSFIRRLFLPILVLLSLMPDSKACEIEYCEYWPDWYCQEIVTATLVTYQVCYEYEECYDDGEEYYCFYDTGCYELDEWEYYYDEECDWIYFEDCWYEWDPYCGDSVGGGGSGGGGSSSDGGDGGGGSGSHSPLVTVTSDASQTINLGQSAVYGSTASVSNDALVSHDFDWMPPGGNWVSGSSNSAGPGTVALGALTGGADRSLSVDMQTNSTRSLTMTPTQPGSYSVRFSASNTSGERGYSSTKTLTVDNQAPGLMLRTPSTVFAGESIIIRAATDNPTGLEHYQTGLEVSSRILNVDGTVNQNWSILSTQAQATGNRAYESTLTGTGANQAFIIEIKGRAWNEQWTGHYTSVEKTQRVRVLVPPDPGADGTPDGMTLDSNGNGIPDYVETLLGFDPTNPSNNIPDNIRRLYQYDHSDQLLGSPEGAFDVDPEGNVTNNH
jgi:hypothetical protein